ncbi:hypothetical protein J4408_02045 [Candidatus Pacearchaeota archaeon]|nr:hypothetical protein [Candidatus Pacearchaeota archaeon]
MEDVRSIGDVCRVDRDLSRKDVLRMGRIISKGMDSLEFKIADTIEELQSSFNLCTREEKRAGYITQEDDVYYTTHFFLPMAKTIVGKINGEVALSASVINDSHFGFFMEELNDFKIPRKGLLQSCNIAEITGLATNHEKYKEQIGFGVFYPMFFFYKHALKQKIDNYVIEVVDKSADLYRRFWGFEPIDSRIENRCNKEMNMLLLVNDMSYLCNKINKYKAEANGELYQLAPFLTETPFDNKILNSRAYKEPLSPEVIRHFLKEKTNTWDLLPYQSKKIFMELHSAHGNDLGTYLELK